MGGAERWQLGGSLDTPPLNPWSSGLDRHRTMTLNKREKLAGMRKHWGSLPLPLEPRRRGSMPLPYKHQLRRAQAVDELDWPSVHSGSSDSVRSTDSISEPGVYKVMLLGESGVGKTTLAGIFGGVEDSYPHETDHSEDTYERNMFVDGEKTTLIVYDIWDQSWMQDSCLQMGDAFLLIFSVTDRSSFQRLPGLLLQLRTARPNHRIPVILVGNKGDLARSREVNVEEGRSLANMLNCKYTETSAALHHNTQELLEGVVRQIRLRREEGEHVPQPATLLPPGRRESMTKRARRLLHGLMGKHRGFFKQRSKSCHDLSVL
ncbi:GTP-binding protein REM 2 isoform X2 [Spea bombifrons]|uniref:GTP-binding protein REM 2 isoform X2 n=1 Tax=Spea bombifrons TaxID=233779 RepID=UPI00234B64BC|nr:GTP-binding protein REM 2 isoform X2 [Spea bombifrons]